MRLRRIVQTISFLFFLALIGLAAWTTLSAFPLDLVLRTDPGAALITGIADRDITHKAGPALVIVLMTLVLGRVFCGWICPMGILLNVTDTVFEPKRRRNVQTPRWRWVKFGALGFLIAAALVGVSFAFVAVPIPLVTRLAALVAEPVLSLIGAASLNVLRPLAESAGLNALSFASIDVPHYATQFFVLTFFISIISLIVVAPRFWCRNLCPSGALLALFAFKPVYRRQVADSCNNCGKCVHDCPMDAIPLDAPATTRFEECIVCRSCETSCPNGGVSFGFANPFENTERPAFSPNRRKVMTTALAGAGVAATGLTGTGAKSASVRPPGSLPEEDFLDRCVRCANCLAVCPTNVLQPTWFAAGSLGVFSPVLDPRFGYCDVDCNRCGPACPTGAIRRLDMDQRLWAKCGTAHIIKERCLAWEDAERCMVCDEVCPVDAIHFDPQPGISVAVPRVAPEKCTGCGACENACPVPWPRAIHLEADGAVRLRTGDVEAEARARGLNIARADKVSTYPTTPAPTSEAPGFDSAPAPGFDSDLNSQNSGMPSTPYPPAGRQ